MFARIRNRQLESINLWNYYFNECLLFLNWINAKFSRTERLTVMNVCKFHLATTGTVLEWSALPPSPPLLSQNTLTLMKLNNVSGRRGAVVCRHHYLPPGLTSTISLNFLAFFLKSVSFHFEKTPEVLNK